MGAGPRRKDVTGGRFDRLVAIKYIKTDHRRRAVWLFACDCGNHKEYPAVQVRSGHTKSCGCLLRATLSKGKYRHGMSRTPTWRSWVHMRQRCSNPSEERWKNYGERGIRVCDRWQVFDNFLADMGEATDGHSIERINVNGNYEPGNCRWAFHDEQYSNTTRTVTVEIHGHRVAFRDLVKLSGVKYSTANARLFRYGWTAERTFPNVTPESLHAI